MKQVQGRRERKLDAKSWMIFGACGELGHRMVRQSKSEGLSPVIADFSVTQLRQMSRSFELPWRLIDYSQPEQTRRAFQGVEFVYCACDVEDACKLIALLAEKDVIIVVPGQVPQSVVDQIPRAGAKIISDVGFHTAAFDSLLAYAQVNLDVIKSVQVVMLGLPFSSPGYGRLVKDWQLLKQKRWENLLQSLATENVDWRAKLFRAITRYRGQMWFSRGWQLLGTQWWKLYSPEMTRASDFPVTVYSPAVTFIFSKLSFLTRVTRPGKLSESLSEFIGSVVLRSPFRQLSADVKNHVTGRSAIWMIAESESSEHVVYGLECPVVYDFTARLGLEVCLELLSQPSLVQLFNRVDRPIASMVDILGPDFILRVPHTLRFGCHQPLSSKRIA